MTRLKRMAKGLAIITVMIAGLAFFGLTESAPRIATPATPDATLIGAGRDALRQVRHAGVALGEPIQIRISPAERDGLTALANQALGPIRVASAQQGDKLTFEASKPLPLGRWFNVTAQIAGESDGFPPTRLTIGHLSLSPKWSRWLIDKAAIHFRQRGVAVPPLDQLVQHLAIGADHVTATVQLPTSEASLAGLAVVTGQETQMLDPDLLARTYCALADLQTRQPSTDFSLHVRRAFAVPRTNVSPSDQNRANLIALAMLAVDTSIDDLAGEAKPAITKCRIPSPVLILGGRDDLSRHWALSAGLSARLGTDLARTMGVWKELLDSLPHGSGFSFVDLAADRSGFRHARAATAPDHAQAMAEGLAKATDAMLVPPSLLKGPEDMTQQKWEARYTNTDTQSFERAIATIDAQLDLAGTP